MAYTRGFVNVPVEWLELDPATSSGPGHYSPEQYRLFMEHVPEIHRRLLAGQTDQEFHHMMEVPANQEEREIGETYRNLFTDSASAEPLRATFVDGQGLVVDKGQHRVIASRELQLPSVPVQVQTSDPGTFYRIRAAAEEQLARTSPDQAHLVDIYREYDKHLVPDRSPIPSPERRLGPERLEVVRERGWSPTELER